MHPLLRFTRDLFEHLEPEAQGISVQGTPKKGVKKPPPGPYEAGQPLPQAIAPAQYVHPQATRQVRLEEAVVAYAFARGKRRTIGFSVGPEGLAVRAPRWTPLYEVEAALQEKSGWILRKLAEVRERQAVQQQTQIVWREGAQFPFLGQPVRIVLDAGHGFAAQGAQLDAQPDAWGVPHSAAPEQLRDAVQAWLMRQARTHFLQRLDHFAPQLQVRWTKLSLSNAATRWGSAKTDGSIRLNWRLIHFRPPVIDYVVAHELSHLRVMDHSPRFWDTVRSVVPDYAALRHTLKDPTIPKW